MWNVGSEMEDAAVSCEERIRISWRLTWLRCMASAVLMCLAMSSDFLTSRGIGGGMVAWSTLTVER